MKKLLALLLAMVMVLSMAACSNEKNENPKNEKPESSDGTKPSDSTQPTEGVQPPADEALWLISSVTEYDTEGVAFRKTTYTYTDKGLIQKLEKDNGPVAEVWHEDENMYVITYFGAYDGKPEYVMEYFYSEQGDLKATNEKKTSYDLDGNVIQEDRRDNQGNCCYHYNKNGEITSVDCFPRISGESGYADEAETVGKYVYDRYGRLFEIHRQSGGLNRLTTDLRYDSQGRLVGFTARPFHGIHYYQFEYDGANRMTGVKRIAGHDQASIDDQHTFAPMGGTNTVEVWGVLRQSASFLYNEDGELLHRYINDGEGNCTSEVDISYKDGKFDTMVYNGEKFAFTDTDAYIGGSDVTMVRDENGNVVKMILKDGSYLVMEYQKLELEGQYVARCRNNYQSIHSIDPMGSSDSQYHSTLVAADCSGYRPVVETALFPIDLLYYYLSA